MSSDRSPSPAPSRSHRQIGEQLDLAHFPLHAAGQACWHPDGLVLYRLVEELVRGYYRAGGYQEVRSPLLCDQAFWERSGHWQKFSDKMVLACCQGRDGALKPMNCPGHAELYALRPRSHRELPLRIAELGHVHRAEQSGELNGLLRARAFVIDDAHVFARPDQVQAELAACLDSAREVYRAFALPVSAELSLRPAGRLGDDGRWDAAENALREALEHAGMPYVESAGEGAFYGPKIDLHIRDGLGRAWQMGSVQLDYQLPERFDLRYVAADGRDGAADGSPNRPVIIHRALLGSLERFIGVLLESDDGWLPAWCSPHQVDVLPVSADHLAAAEHVAASLSARGVRASVRVDGPLGARVRQGGQRRVPVLAVIGAREADDGSVAARLRDGSQRQLEVGELAALVSPQGAAQLCA